MQRSSSMRCVLVALAMICGPALSWSADRKGTMDEDCCGTTFHLRILHTGKEKGSPEKELVLRLAQGCPGHIPLRGWVSEGWIKVEGKVCVVSSSRCDPVKKAEMQIEVMNEEGGKATGSYRIDFSDDRHEEGKFVAKY